MKSLLTSEEIKQFKRDGAALIKGKFHKQWIDKLRRGIDEDIKKIGRE